MTDAGSAPRLRFVDRLRGLAVVVMIEVHVVNALLSPTFRDSAPFRALDFVNGLVAPAFLFCAGYAAGFGPRALRRDLRRSGILLALGYALHASALVRGDFAGFLQVDVLQVMAVALFVVGLTNHAPARLRPALQTALGVALVLAAPWTRAADTTAWPAPLRPYWTEAAGSQFPLAPWAAIPLLGAASSAIATKRLGVAALGACAFAATLHFAKSALPAHDAWRAGPDVAAIRVALVVAVASMLARIEALDFPRSDRLSALVGRRSLLVYFAHIIVVYGTHPLSLRSLVGPRLGPLACLATWALVTGSMALLAAKAPRVKLY